MSPDPQNWQEGSAYYAKVKNKSRGGGLEAKEDDNKKNVGLLQFVPPRINTERCILSLYVAIAT